MTHWLLINDGGDYTPLYTLAYPHPLYIWGPLPRIPPPIWHIVRGKKGGQSPLQSIHKKKVHMGLKKILENF